MLDAQVNPLSSCISRNRSLYLNLWDPFIWRLDRLAPCSPKQPCLDMLRCVAALTATWTLHWTILNICCCSNWSKKALYVVFLTEKKKTLYIVALTELRTSSTFCFNRHARPVQEHLRNARSYIAPINSVSRHLSIYDNLCAMNELSKSNFSLQIFN